MRKQIAAILWVILYPAYCYPAWNFQEVNAPGSSTSIIDSGIAWRPQGDYALIARDEILYRYEYATGILSFEIHSGENLWRAEWSPSGEYALITGNTEIYRYDHAAGGFGTLTEITSIQGSGTYSAINFFDIVFNPAAPDDPPYISSNRQQGSDKMLVLYRYDPMADPQVYWDYSGGTSYNAGGGYMSFAPVSMAFQADGDYIVVANRYGLEGQGFHVYDPDQSTFPTRTGGAMQYFSGNIGNANVVVMSPVSGSRFVLIKGTGVVRRFVEQSMPATFVESDPGGGWYTTIFGGDGGYSYDGTRALFLEQQEWTPNHKFMTFNSAGAFVQHVDILGITNRTVRLYAACWHPFQPMGLMAGEDGWIIRFECTDVPTPTAPPLLTPTPSETPSPSPSPESTSTPIPVPVTSMASTAFLLILISAVILIAFKPRSR